MNPTELTVLLAIDLSTEFCSVALAVVENSDLEINRRKNSGAQIFVRHYATGVMSSAHILPTVREVFDEAKLTLNDCTAIAFGAGPGSFTGLRTAAGVVQGLAFALQLPVVPVSTLMACAQAARDHDPSITRVLAALDARMDEVYWALFDWDKQAADWQTTQPALVTPPEAVNVPSNAPFALAGNAATVFDTRLEVISRASLIDTLAMPHAMPIATLGLRHLYAGRTVSAPCALPEYIRNQVAKKRCP